MPTSRSLSLPRSTPNGCWAHYNASGQVIATGAFVDGEQREQVHLPFEPLPASPVSLLKSDDHMLRVTAERVVSVMLQCLELKNRC